MLLSANTSGVALASATVSGSSGQPGASGAYPASANTWAHRSQLEGSNHSPCTTSIGQGRRSDTSHRAALMDDPMTIHCEWAAGCETALPARH